MNDPLLQGDTWRRGESFPESNGHSCDTTAVSPRVTGARSFTWAPKSRSQRFSISPPASPSGQGVPEQQSTDRKRGSLTGKS
ncbi:MAG: hypothetical protein ACK5VP_04150, partial [Betaproteobacteria bacterium]